MVEQADALLNKDNSKLLSSFEHRAVVLAAARCGHVLDAGSGGAEDIVNEWELQLYWLAFFSKHAERKRGTYESVRRDGNFSKLLQPCLALL